MKKERWRWAAVVSALLVTIALVMIFPGRGGSGRHLHALPTPAGSARPAPAARSPLAGLIAPVAAVPAAGPVTAGASEDQVRPALPGCPAGIEPYVYVATATFTPGLDSGRQFRPGSYTVRVAGYAINETDAPITVSTVLVTVNGVHSSVQPSGKLIPAYGRTDFSLQTTYGSSRQQQAAIHTDLSWHWADTALARCGNAGLVPED
jgi:hypothetical protein